MIFFKTSPFPIFKAEVRYLVHAKMDSWDRQLMIKQQNENGGKLGEAEALIKAQQYKYCIHHMYRKLSKLEHTQMHTVSQDGVIDL